MLSFGGLALSGVVPQGQTEASDDDSMPLRLEESKKFLKAADIKVENLSEELTSMKDEMQRKEDQIRTLSDELARSELQAA